MARTIWLVLLPSVVLAAPDAIACGGLFCNQTNVVVPPAQSSERIIFVMNPAGWSQAPEAIVEPAQLEGVSDLDPSVDLPSVDTYIEIAYRGAADSFAWIVPLLQPPSLVGTAASDIFDDFDSATAPRFTFVYSSGSTTVASSGTGCGGLASSAGGDTRSAADGIDTQPEVTVVGTGRVGPYDIVLLQSETAADLRAWLVQNEFEVPAMAEPILQTYVDEGKTFLALKLSDGQGVGAIQPILIRTPGGEPCIPLRLTPVASEPVLSVAAIVLGSGLVRPVNFSDSSVNEDAVRPTSPLSTSYQADLRDAVQKLDGLAVQTEFAGPWAEVTTPTAQAMLARTGFVTRLATRIAPEEMTVDPIFTETFNTMEIPRDHTIDVTNDRQALDALGVSPPPDSSSDSDDGGCASANGRPLASLWMPCAVAVLALFVRRRRSR